MKRKHPTLTNEAFDEAIRAAARCRAMRYHRMDIVPGDPDRRPSFGTLITYRCETCGTLRYDIVSRLTGQLLTRSYDAPDWYLQANEGRHDTSWWRATWFETLDASLYLDADEQKPARGRRQR